RANSGSWTKLEFNQCPHCPLKADTSPQCPIARNLDQVVEDSKSTISWTKARVTVTTPERTFSRECSTQDGLRSLFGLLMASSGGPLLDWLRPLARVPLPFAGEDESGRRVLSVPRAEDFRTRDQSDPKGSGQRLAERYTAVETVNPTFKKRIR